MMSRISFHGMTCRISYRIGMFLLEYEYERLSEHCMCTLMGSSSGRRYSLLGVAHPLWDNPFRCRVDIGGALIIPFVKSAWNKLVLARKFYIKEL